MDLYTSSSGLLAATLAFLDILLKVIALIVVPNNRKPSSANAWLLAIFFVPLIGLPLYLILGKSVLSKVRNKKQKYITNKIKKILNSSPMINSDPAFAYSSQLAKNLTNFPVSGSTKFSVIDDYSDFIDRLSKEIKKAKKYIWLEFYIMAYDKTTAELFDALIEAKSRGVEIKILYDFLGTLTLNGRREMIQLLKQHKIENYPMMPISIFSHNSIQRPDLRNHRKLAIIDGELGYTGSQNIIDSSYNKIKNIKRGLNWKDLMISLNGPIVKQLEAVFINDWYAETNEDLTNRLIKNNQGSIKFNCQLVPSGPGYESENNLKVFNQFIYAAKEKIVITSPYFVPDESMIQAILTAAERGVKVSMYVSEIGDQFLVYHAQRSYYTSLMKAGVVIYLYKSPIVLHSKHVTLDNDIAIIGSSNMDIRSLELNQEVSLIVKDKKVVNKLRFVEAGYMKNSRKLILKQWEKRPKQQKIIDNLARLTSGVQ